MAIALACWLCGPVHPKKLDARCTGAGHGVPPLRPPPAPLQPPPPPPHAQVAGAALQRDQAAAAADLRVPPHVVATNAQSVAQLEQLFVEFDPDELLQQVGLLVGRLVGWLIGLVGFISWLVGRYLQMPSPARIVFSGTGELLQQVWEGGKGGKGRGSVGVPRPSTAASTAKTRPHLCCARARARAPPLLYRRTAAALGELQGQPAHDCCDRGLGAPPQGCLQRTQAAAHGEARVGS